MATLLTPNSVYTMNGVKIREKIIPDGSTWKTNKGVTSGFNVGDLYKRNCKLSGNTGKVQFITIHNTADLGNVSDDAEQYTRATYNENMGSARVHFYVDENGAWQNLKAGTGLTTSDPAGSAEVGWHAGDGNATDGGNMTSIAMEIIMGNNADDSKMAYMNGAKITAWLLWKNGLTIDSVVSHTYWVNKSAGTVFSDVDKQCTNIIYGKKWCPSYIFASSNTAKALENWKAFKSVIQSYLDKLNNPSEEKAEVIEVKETKNIQGTVSKGTDSDNKKIWDLLYAKIGNEYAVAGIMGNLKVESGLKSDNMENSYESKIGYNDVTYTNAVDNGTYANFVNDAVGYGIAQWTWWSRKQGLLQLAQTRNKSISDIETQVIYLMRELNASFKSLLTELKNVSSVETATDGFLYNFERPTRKDCYRNRRVTYALEFYNKFATNKKGDDTMTFDQFKEFMKKYREELQDNDSGAWSKDAREWAINNGFIQGTGEESGLQNYAWEDQITREQVVTLFYRFAKLMGKA